MRTISNAVGTRACLCGGLLLALLCLGTASFGQQPGTGVVRGRVMNQATGDYLPGAQVRVEGTNLATTTDREGEYRLSVPPGNQTLVVSFTGLETERASVSITAGQSTVHDVGLTSQVYALEEYAVTGIREGNALALQLQRQAANVKTVAATDTFGNPAQNPGELIQRLPGITTDIVGGEVRQVQIRGMDRTFNSVMIDGNRVANAGSASYIREVQVEQLGTTNIETVEVIKAPTPDMDADAIAGYVNMITKRAFDRPPGRRISFTAGSIWKVRKDDSSPEEDSPGLDLAVLGYSDVFSVLGGENNLGVAVNGLYRQGSTLQDEVTHNYRTTGATGPDSTILQNTFQTREFADPDFHYNFGFNADYKLSDDAFLYFRSTINQRYQYQRGRGMAWTGGNALATYEPGWSYEYTKAKPVAATRFRIFSQNFTKKTYNYSFNVGGQHTLGGGDLQLNYDGFFSYAASWYPDRNLLEADVRGVGIEIDRRNTDAWYPEVSFSGADVFDPDVYSVGNFDYIRNKSNNTLNGFKLDLRKDFNLGIPTYVKTGVKWGSERRVRNADESRLRYTGDDPSINRYLDEGYTYKQAAGHYGPWPTLEIPETGRPGDVERFIQENPGEWEVDYFRRLTRSTLNDAKIEETVKAAYVMGNLDFGRFRVLGGVRVEDVSVWTQNWIHELTAAERKLRREWTGPVTPEEQTRRANAEYPGQAEATGGYRDVFPGMHLVYEPWDGLLVRASWNTSITRPPVGQILPGFDVDEENQRVTVGNPDLQPFYSDNFEFGFEKYFEPIGIIGAGVFLKEIENYSTVVSSAVGSGADNGFGGDYEGYELRQRQNLGNARIRGFEINYQQQLSFLPGFWKGFGLFANYTRLEAQGNYGGAVTRSRLSGLTPKSGNAGISYVDHGWQIRFMANYRASHPRGNASSFRTTWRDERTLYDVKVQYQLNRRFDLFLDISNLLDEPTRRDMLEFGHVRFEARQGMTMTAGVKGRF